MPLDEQGYRDLFAWPVTDVTVRPFTLQTIFGMQPMPNQDLHQLFWGEYYYQRARLQAYEKEACLAKALEHHNYKALSHFASKACQRGDFARVEEYLEMAQQYYAQAGLYLRAYTLLTWGESNTLTRQRLNDAMNAMIEVINAHDDAVSQIAFANLGIPLTQATFQQFVVRCQKLGADTSALTAAIEQRFSVGVSLTI